MTVEDNPPPAGTEGEGVGVGVGEGEGEGEGGVRRGFNKVDPPIFVGEGYREEWKGLLLLGREINSMDFPEG